MAVPTNGFKMNLSSTLSRAGGESPNRHCWRWRGVYHDLDLLLLPDSNNFPGARELKEFGCVVVGIEIDGNANLIGGKWTRCRGLMGTA
eukprot:CAMPEP_0183764234 /NCGR_PEP_ID=MMETSP0739-20130205/10186_1 /TAXON_ID=385413 /ORGANISM="Thalassiosira miniscula, Strain CCMP1093" /LENGTH=88 /DNA_ID=CAMNT_0026002743 /DNA_START=125 /DNA_END=391 /DNA_ORIENTATION=-